MAGQDSPSSADVKNPACVQRAQWHGTVRYFVTNTSRNFASLHSHSLPETFFFIFHKYIRNQSVAFSPPSDWLTKLGIVSTIHPPPPRIVLDFSREVLLIYRKKEIFGAGYPWVLYVLKQLFT